MGARICKIYILESNPFYRPCEHYLLPLFLGQASCAQLLPGQYLLAFLFFCQGFPAYLLLLSGQLLLVFPLLFQSFPAYLLFFPGHCLFRYLLFPPLLQGFPAHLFLLLRQFHQLHEGSQIAQQLPQTYHGLPELGNIGGKLHCSIDIHGKRTQTDAPSEPVRNHPQPHITVGNRRLQIIEYTVQSHVKAFPLGKAVKGIRHVTIVPRDPLPQHPCHIIQPDILLHFIAEGQTHIISVPAVYGQNQFINPAHLNRQPLLKQQHNPYQRQQYSHQNRA